MRGYAALARIDASSIHVARAAVAPKVPLPEARADHPSATWSGHMPVPPTARLAELAQSVREQWAITTFFLFDPESWR